MGVTLWVRIAAALAALFAAAHTAGMPRAATKDVLAQGVVAAMRSVHFQAAGLTRSYWDFYQGFGLAVSAFLAMEAVLLWQLAGIASTGGRYRGMAVTHAAGFGLLALISLRYVFAVPVALAAAISVCLIVAILRPGPALSRVGKSVAWPRRQRSVRCPCPHLPTC